MRIEILPFTISYTGGVLKMEKQTEIIWLYTLDFLKLFFNIEYDQVPIAIPLLRDFQRFVARHFDFAYLEKADSTLNLSIQKACEPFLLDTDPHKTNEGYILVRSDLYSLTSNLKPRNWLFLAHHEKEYRNMLKNKQCRPLLYLSKLPEAKLPLSEEKNVMNDIKQRYQDPNTFFFSKVQNL